MAADLMTGETLIDAMGASDRTMLRLLKREGLPVHEKAGKKWRYWQFEVQEVYEWLRSHRKATITRYATPLRNYLSPEEEDGTMTVRELLLNDGYKEIKIDPNNISEVAKAAAAIKDIALGHRKILDNAAAAREIVPVDSVNQLMATALASMSEIFSDTFASDLALAVENRGDDDTIYSIVIARVREGKRDLLAEVNATITELGLDN